MPPPTQSMAIVPTNDSTVSNFGMAFNNAAPTCRAAAASVDDVGVAASRAGSKTAGVVIDDAAVTPSFATGLTPDRELPLIANIAKGSLKNKLIILLPGALLLSEFLPWAIIPILMLGGVIVFILHKVFKLGHAPGAH